MNLSGINPTANTRSVQANPAQPVDPTDRVGQREKFDVGGSSDLSTRPTEASDANAASEARGPEAGSLSHQMTTTIRDGLTAGQERQQIFDRVVNDQITAELGEGIPAGVREQTVQAMTQNPVVREMFDRLLQHARS